jgi:CHAD domain-containing protein
MEVFETCFPRKRFRKALKEVKALADALGARRDLDVEVEFLERYASEAEDSDRQGVSALLAALREERLRANHDLAPLVSAERLERMRRRLRRLVEGAPG